MKRLWCGILFFLSGALLFADTQPQTVAPIEWADWSRHGFGEPEATDFSFLYNPTQYVLDHKGGKPLDLPLFTLGPAIASKIHAVRYAITGNLVCQGVAPGSYLEATSYLTTAGPDGKPLSTTVRTEGSNGTQSAIEGDDSNRVVELPFKLPANATVDHITLHLHLEGNGYIAFSGMKLVEYVDKTAAVPSGLNPLADGHLTVGITMNGSTVCYSLAGMGNVSLDSIREMLRAPEWPILPTPSMSPRRKMFPTRRSGIFSMPFAMRASARLPSVRHRHHHPSQLRCPKPTPLNWIGVRFCSVC